jgi:NADH-quinone oxidoreductase subunit N
MNIAASILEIAVIVLGVVIMLADLWVPHDKKNWLGYASIAGLAMILFGSMSMSGNPAETAFGNMYVLDSFAMFFKRFFLIAAILVIAATVEYSHKCQTG